MNHESTPEAAGEWHYVENDFGGRRAYTVCRVDGSGPVMPAMINADGAQHWVDYLNALEADHAAIEGLRAKAALYDTFMDWLTDQQIINWTLTKENENDPIEGVKAIINQMLAEFKDPAISKIAAKAALADDAYWALRTMLLACPVHEGGDAHNQAEIVVFRYDALIRTEATHAP